MARYSKVALYHKVQNAAYNQANKLKPSPVKKTAVQIPEAKNTADSAGLIHPELNTMTALLPREVKIGEVENEKDKKSRSDKGSKKMPKKAAPGSKVKNSPAGKRASSSKTKRPAAKAGGKKMTKKLAGGSKSAVKSSAKKVVSKAKRTKKMTIKKGATKKVSSRKPAKKIMTKSATKSVQRKTK